MSKRPTVYITNDERHEGWEYEPDDCRRESTFSHCARCEDSGWAYSKVEGRLVYCRCECGEWARGADAEYQALNTRPQGGGAVEDALATDEPGMVDRQYQDGGRGGVEVAIR